MPQDGHVAGAEACAQAELVFFEGDVEDPMQAVCGCGLSPPRSPRRDADSGGW
jgi:hypothetical protein